MISDRLGVWSKNREKPGHACKSLGELPEIWGKLPDEPPGSWTLQGLVTSQAAQLHREGVALAQIADRLNAEGFVPPRRRGGFTASGVGELMRDLGLVGELFRDDLVGQDEWWILDLSRELGVIPQKVHYWVKQGWVHARRTPSGKHWIVWADRDELRRLQELAKRRNSWIAARDPELIVPKDRPKPASKRSTAGNPAGSAAPRFSNGTKRRAL